MLRRFKTQITVSVGITLLLVAVLGITLFYLNKDIVSSSKAINSMRTEFFSRSRAIASLNELRSDADQARIYLDVLNSSLPTREDLPAFNTEVFNLEKTNNLPLSFKFGGMEVAPQAGVSGEIAFDLNLNGGYTNIVNFLKDLEASSYVTDINNFDLVGGGEKDEYRALFSGTVFFH